MNIGIDIDGVLTDLYSFQVYSGNKYYNMPPKDINGYDYEGLYNVTKEESDSIWNIYIQEYFSKGAREHAKEVIDYFHECGHKIIIITARTKNLVNPTLEWLQKNGIYYDKIYFTGENKRDKIIEEKIDYMIEDSPTNILSLCELCKVIAIDSKYNEHISKDNVYRAYDWLDVKKIIEE